MSPITSSWVSATSRISRPTSRVRARPADGGVWTSRARTPYRRGEQAKQLLEGERVRPGSVGHGVLAWRASRHRLGRKVFGVDGLDRVVAAPIDGEDREAPQGPGHVVEQQVAFAEYQGQPDDGVRDSQAHQHVLHLRLAPEVWQV